MRYRNHDPLEMIQIILQNRQRADIEVVGRLVEQKDVWRAHQDMEQKEWETIEDDIAALEEAIADLEQQMQDSARDYTALNGIIKEKEEKEALLEEKMDRWMYLNDLAEKIEAQAAAHK